MQHLEKDVFEFWINSRRSGGCLVYKMVLNEESALSSFLPTTGFQYYM